MGGGSNVATFGDLIGGVIKATFPAHYPLGTLHTVTLVEAENGDMSSTPVDRPIRVQREPATESMRREAGYTDKDVALIVLHSTGLDIDTDAQVTDGEGNLWSVASVEFDAALSHWVLRGSTG